MMGLDILQAKLYFPVPGKDAVLRPRLVSKLSRAMACRVTTVVAPAGYGKTVLASQWFAQAATERRAAFLSLDTQDNDPSTFVAYVCAAFASLKNDQEWEELCLSCAEERDPMRVIARLASRLEELEETCVLFIDDFHLIVSSEVHQLLIRLVEMGTGSVSYVIMGRYLPGLPLSRWRLERLLREIVPSDLVFSDNEADELLGLDGTTNDALKSELLYVRAVAEGWAAGLRLGLFALDQFGSTDSRSRLLKRKGNFAWQYLWEEVFCQQPEDLQVFLMATSIVDQVNERLGDALLEAWFSEEDALSHKTAAHFLSQMLAASLFVVELEGEGGWCRYHHLMREYSLNRLRSEFPEAYARLNQAACEWYFSNGFETQAIALAMSCGDWEYAADILERAGLKALSKGWGLPIVGWFNSLPEGVADSRPLLAILEAWGYALSSRADNLGMVNWCIEFAEGRLDRMKAPVAEVCRGHLDLIKAFRYLVPSLIDRDTIRDTDLSSALSLSPREDPRGAAMMVLGWSSLAKGALEEAIGQFAHSRDASLQAPHYFSYVESAFSACYVLARLGKVQEALSLCNFVLDLLVVRMSIEQGETPLTGPLFLIRGLLFVTEGLLEEAERELENGMRFATSCLLPHYQLIGVIALFDIYELQGRGADVFPVLDRFEFVWPDVSFCMKALRTEHYLTNGAYGEIPESVIKDLGNYVDLAESYADNVGGLGPLHGGYAFERAWTIWLRLMIEFGLDEKAIALIDRRLSAYGDERPTAVVAELLLVRSYALFEKDPDAALAQFDEAFSLVDSPSRFRTLTLDKRFPPLLSKRKLHFQENAREDAAGRCQSAGSLILTKKESEVVQLAGKGLSNKAIAQRMGIGEGTVKQHMSHLMRKLGARNRTEAYAIANDIGLL